MRRIAVVLIGLIGLALLWRQFVRRQRDLNGNALGSALPVWTPAAPSSSVVQKFANTAERTHNQSDALTQPAEPAPPPPPPASAEVLAPSESAQTLEAQGETEQASESAEALETADQAEAIKPDDLIRIEGIGPKISTIVVAAGITSFAELAGEEVGRLEDILHAAGIHTANPSTWPEQAHLAAQGQWDALKELQDRIKNGRLEA